MEGKIDVAPEIEKYKKIGLFKKPKNQLLNFLALTTHEEVLINLRLFPIIGIFINNIREPYAKRLILTTNRIIFILNRGYLFKEFFQYETISDILITTKLVSAKDYPVIMIKTLGNTYEILFTKIFPYDRRIKGIVDCIKNRNPNISVEINSKYDDADYSPLFTKIEFK